MRIADGTVVGKHRFDETVERIVARHGPMVRHRSGIRLASTRDAIQGIVLDGSVACASIESFAAVKDGALERIHRERDLLVGDG